MTGVEQVQQSAREKYGDVPPAPKHGEIGGGHTRNGVTISGHNTAERTVSRLKRDDPDLAERVLNDEITPNADQQVGQVVARGNLTTLRVAGEREIDLLGSQDVILRTSAESLADGTQIVRTPGGDQQLEVRWTAPAVVDGRIVVHPRHRSPLDADEHGRFPTVLRGGVVTDPGEVEQIRARVERPLWRRMLTGWWS